MIKILLLLVVCLSSGFDQTVAAAGSARLSNTYDQAVAAGSARLSNKYDQAVVVAAGSSP